MKFNDIANAISVISGVTLAGIVGVGVYTYANKDAIIDGIKEAAIESVMGSLGDGLPGTGALESLPLGTNDLPSPSPQASMPSAPQAPVQF
tara:strand:+ start:1421 stop:1693 length:273 start_codon:yes stop_codon:yes gene_type:complete